MPADRLSALDIAFLCLDEATTPMHMGAVATFAPTGPVDGHRIAELVAERAGRVSRLRSRARFDPPPLPGASWDPDPAFDPADHVDVRHLGAPDSGDPLVRAASAWMSDGLDLDAPLWKARVVTGLPGDRFALMLKLHHALADGTGAARLAFGLLDDTPAGRQHPRPAAKPPRPRPGPRQAWESLFHGTRDAVGHAVQSAGIATAVLRAARPYPPSATLTPNCARRRVGFVRLDLGEVRAVRAAHGGTTNDVVLAVLAGALREWLLNDGRRPDPHALRALVPVSVRGRAGGRGAGNALSGYLCDLPVGTEDPVERLRSVRRVMEHNKRAGPTRGPGALPILAERIPTGLHRLATRAVGHAAPLLFDTVVTNVPLPGLPMSLGGAALREVYPLVPLAPHQALGVAVSGYRDALHVGLQANGEAVPDVGSLADAVTKSLAALYHRGL